MFIKNNFFFFIIIEFAEQIILKIKRPHLRGLFINSKKNIFI